jgi:hypothetical protein
MCHSTWYLVPCMRSELSPSWAVVSCSRGHCKWFSLLVTCTLLRPSICLVAQLAAQPQVQASRTAAYLFFVAAYLAAGRSHCALASMNDKEAGVPGHATMSLLPITASLLASTTLNGHYTCFSFVYRALSLSAISGTSMGYCTWYLIPCYCYYNLGLSLI